MPTDAGSVIASVYDGLIQKLKQRNSDLASEVIRQAEYIELLENQVIVAMTVDEPVPFLPVDPEEKRRLDALASDGRQCMVYRSNP